MIDKQIIVDGVKLAYTLSGTGRSIVLLHGWMCNRKFWKRQIEVLSRTHRVLALDFRGHGNSDVTEGGYTIHQLADDVRHVMNGLSIERAVVVGHSMGGMVAQQFCLSYKDYAAALILVTTIAADPEDCLISKRIERDARDLGFRNAFLRHFDGWFGATTESNLIHWVREEMLHTPETVGLKLVLAYRRFDLRTHLLNLRLPTLVIGTASDASAVPAESEILAELIPGANLVTIEEAGHFPMLENPHALNKAMEAFLSIVE